MIEEIAPNIYIGAGFSRVTLGAILTTTGWVCIDTPPYPSDAQAWRAHLAAASRKPVRYLINTDHHRDRIICNQFFDAPVITHQETAKRIFKMKNSVISYAADELNMSDTERLESTALKIVPPHFSFNESFSITDGRRNIQLEGNRGPTGGSLHVLTPDEKVIFTGDTLIKEQHPFLDGGDVKVWLDLIEVLKSQDYKGWTFVSGRDGIIKPKDTQPLTDYLLTAYNRVEELHGEDRPRSEVASLISEFIGAFPAPEGSRDELYRRIKVGLESIYDRINQDKPQSLQDNGLDDEDPEIDDDIDD